MIYEGVRYFEIPDAKPVFAEGLSEIDISEFLADDAIVDVGWTAAKEDGTDATADVITVASCEYDNDEGTISPWIKAGTSGETYICTMQVTLDSGFQEEYYLRWSIV